MASEAVEAKRRYRRREEEIRRAARRLASRTPCPAPRRAAQPQAARRRDGATRQAKKEKGDKGESKAAPPNARALRKLIWTETHQGGERLQVQYWRGSCLAGDSRAVVRAV